VIDRHLCLVIDYVCLGMAIYASDELVRAKKVCDFRSARHKVATILNRSLFTR